MYYSKYGCFKQVYKGGTAFILGAKAPRYSAVEEAIKKVEPDIEDKILFKTTELITKDKAVLMKREQLEEWTFGMIEDDL